MRQKKNTIICKRKWRERKWSSCSVQKHIKSKHNNTTFTSVLCYYTNKAATSHTNTNTCNHSHIFKRTHTSLKGIETIVLAAWLSPMSVCVCCVCVTIGCQLSCFFTFPPLKVLLQFIIFLFNLVHCGYVSCSVLYIFLVFIVSQVSRQTREADRTEQVDSWTGPAHRW